MEKSFTFNLPQRLLALAILLINALSPAWAEEMPFVVHGIVRDRATNAQLVGANVEVLDAQDSLLFQTQAKQIDYQNGKWVDHALFAAPLPRQKAVFNIRIAYEDYDTLVQPIDLTDMGRREMDRDLGTFFLSATRVTTLGEVTVTASKIKFYNRGDTIVYNADAFKLAEGSMLDALVKQLPGVELRDGGQIYVNGEFVESLLLNGKDFFKGDNQIMLDNLGAYTVSNLEVYRRQDERAEFLGLDQHDDKQLVMDVKLKKEYMGGWNINAEAGGGTDDRYLARLFAMHFTALSPVTAYGNVNNLNDSRSPSAENEWNPATRPEGTQTFREGGITYSKENETSTRKAQGNLVLRTKRTLYDDRTSTSYFLPQGNSYDYAFSRRNLHDFYIHTHHEFLYQSNLLSLSIKPSYEFRYGKEWSTSESSTFDTEQLPDSARAIARRILGGSSLAIDRRSLVNAVFNQAYSGDYHMNLGALLDLSIKAPKTSDYIDLSLSYTKKKPPHQLLGPLPHRLRRRLPPLHRPQPAPERAPQPRQRPGWQRLLHICLPRGQHQACIRLRPQLPAPGQDIQLLPRPAQRRGYGRLHHRQTGQPGS